MYSFDWPLMFFLLPLPVLLYWLRKPLESSGKQALKVPYYRQINNLSQQHSTQAGTSFSATVLLAFLAWILLISACAQPKWFGETIEIPVSGRDLMLAVDISGSMETADMFFAQDAVNRLTAVKSVLQPLSVNARGIAWD